jgi:HTH-type transcriptional regulator/antitoxin HigA
MKNIINWIVQPFKYNVMSMITKEQYEFAQARIEELLPLVDDNTPANDKNAVELTMMSDIVIAYEKEHYPIEKPTVAELIELSLEEKGMTQRQLANEIGVSPSRVNDYIAGRSEPTLRVARMLCRVLEIQPAAMLGF